MSHLLATAPPASAFVAGDIPLADSLGILAALLALAGAMLLFLLAVLWRQRRRLQTAERALREQRRETERQREAGRRAATTERELRQLSARLPVAVFAAYRDDDRDLYLDFLAGDLHALFGIEAADIPASGGRFSDAPFRERIHPEDRDALRRHLRLTLRHADSATLDFRAYGADQLRWLRLTTATHRRDDGGIRWIGYVIDTTSLVTRNQALQAARDAAERASRAKADFLATMSHEIRTPMNGVIGMLELLAHTALDADQRGLLQAVEDSAGVLLQILNDVLDFSKLEAGSLRLDPAPFDPRTLLDNAVGLVAGSLRRKGLHVTVAMDATLAGRLLGDDVRLRQILLNLLNNAGKFTEHGSVAVALRVLGDDGGQQRLRLSVADTGIGIAADRQAALFAPFTQAEAWTARRHGGTGLGLAICRHLVQLMEGRIELTSATGAGTTVAVELRLPVVQREIDRPFRFDGRHAVVRVADAGLAEALDAHLAALGLSVETVPPAQPLRHGIAADFLFVDADDADSPRQVAAHVIALDTGASAPVQPVGDDKRVLLGACPLAWQGVARACALAQERPGRRAASAANPDAVPARSLLPAAPVRPRHAGRILVAEDHPVNRELARRQLALLGYDGDVVADGRAAYDALLSGSYALLMTDCQMPRMDGYALATAWRRHESGAGLPSRLPIVAMTAHALDGEIDRCRAAGMDDYLSKPVQLRALEEKLLAWLPPAAASGGAAAPPMPPPPAPPPDDMLPLLLDTSHADLDAIEQAVAAGDAATAAQRLHRLLGALQIFAAGPGIEQAAQLLEALHDGKHAEALAAMPACIAELRRTLDGLAHRTRASPR